MPKNDRRADYWMAILTTELWVIVIFFCVFHHFNSTMLTKLRKQHTLKMEVEKDRQVGREASFSPLHSL